MKFLALALAVAASFVYAQDVVEPNHVVKVGEKEDGTAGPVFNPPFINAKAGEVIAFQFRFKNHTVTQSSFAVPCTRQFNTVTEELGVDSGFQPVGENPTEFPVWTIRLEDDSAPLWFFCNFGDHCVNGMVFSINPQAEGQGDRTYSAFLEKAKTADHPAPEESVSADFTPPPKTSAESGASTDPTGSVTGTDSTPAPTGSDGTTPTSPAAGDETGTSAGANASDPAAPGSNGFTVKVSGAGIAMSFAALVAALVL